MRARVTRIMLIMLLISVSCSPLQGLSGRFTEEDLTSPVATGEAGAQELAVRLRESKSPRSRMKTLLDVMNAVHIGVYSPEGEPLVRGAERGWGDFYLYDFELQTLTGNLDREQTYDLYAVSSLLEYAGLQYDDRSVTGQNLLDALHASVVDSVQNPDDPNSFVPLLIREIGLQRKQDAYDLAQELELDRVELDGLQLLLVVGDILLPFVYAIDPIEAPLDLSDLTAGGRLLYQRPMQSAGCGSFDATAVKVPYWGKTGIRLGNTLSGLGSKVLPRLKVGGRILAPLVAGFATIEAIHGVMMAIGTEVKELAPRVGPTHYGHGSKGKELEFGIRVINHADFGEKLVRCGWLSSVKFPPKGPVRDVHVVWIIGDLDKHGTLDCKKGLVFPCYSTTGSDGVARLTFTPKDETKPYGQGLEREETGIVTGLAQYLSSQGNSFVGKISEHITPLTGSIVWSVRFHEPQAYQASGYLSGIFCPTRQSTLQSKDGEKVVFIPGEWPRGEVSYAYGGGGCTLTGEGTYVVELDESGQSGTVTANVSGTLNCPGLGSFPAPGGGPFKITADPNLKCGE